MGGVLTNDFRQEHFYGNRLKRLPGELILMGIRLIELSLYFLFL